MNLINEIDNYLIERDIKRRKTRESHYPSDINTCLRQLYYKWINEPVSDPIKPGALLKMSMGNKIHDLIYEYLEAANIEIINEISNKKSIEGLVHPISYRIDNIFIDPETNEMAIIEVKTSYGIGIRNVKKLNRPREGDLKQICLYMFLENIKKGYLLYIATDDGYRTQFIINYDGRYFFCNFAGTKIIADNILDKFKALEKYNNPNRITIYPPRDYKVAIKNGEIKKKFQKDKVEYKSDWQCLYCQWCTLCWKDYIKKYKQSDNSGEFDEGTMVK
jgi:hypothetical protein